MRSIVILGAGELGGALARQLAAADAARRVTLVDDRADVAAGKALDIRQSAPVDRFSTILAGTADESAVVGADVIVVADRAGAGDGEWQGDAAVGLLGRVSPLNGGALLLCAGARQIDLVERGVREMGIDRRRLIGSAPEALRAAIASLAALEAGCPAADVCLTVVGLPPAQIIVSWDEASIGGRRASAVLAPPAITRLDARLPRLWPPGPLTLATAATRLIAAAGARTRRPVIAFVAATREEGARGRAAMLPVAVAPDGVSALLDPGLSLRDRVRLDTVLQR